jgi:hypothetical protein
MPIESLAIEITNQKDFSDWVYRFGFEPNVINEIQVYKTVRYYIAYLYDLPVESYEAREHYKRLNLFK